MQRTDLKLCTHLFLEGYVQVYTNDCFISSLPSDEESNEFYGAAKQLTIYYPTLQIFYRINIITQRSYDRGYDRCANLLVKSVQGIFKKHPLHGIDVNIIGNPDFPESRQHKGLTLDILRFMKMLKSESKRFGFLLSATFSDIEIISKYNRIINYL